MIGYHSPLQGARKAFGSLLMCAVPEAVMLAHGLIIDECGGAAMHALRVERLRVHGGGSRKGYFN